MLHFHQYKRMYPNVKLERSRDGILEVTFHSNNGPMVFTQDVRKQLVNMFYRIGDDSENRIIILTGSGDAFMKAAPGEAFEFVTLRGYDKIFQEGRALLLDILDIDVPMIAALNGPVEIHSEYVLLCDIILAVPGTLFQDMPPLSWFVSHETIDLLLPGFAGPDGKYPFPVPPQTLTAEEAGLFGAVNAIVPRRELLPRARAFAESLIRLPPLTCKTGRIGFTRRLRRVIEQGIKCGLRLEDGHTVGGEHIGKEIFAERDPLGLRDDAHA